MSVAIDLTGRTAIVTGAASGIGRETAHLFRAAGAHVVVADLDLAGAQRVVAELQRDGGQALAAEVDVRDPDAAQAAVSSTIDRFDKVDILVNNAAAWTIKLFREMSPEEFRRDVDVTLIGTMVMSRAVFGPMREQGGGSIVNLISDSGRVGEAFMVAYGAAKAGVMGFTKGLAKEGGRYQVRVNAVSPGTTMTPGASPIVEMWGGEEKLVKAYPLGRLGQPIDQANAILFLASDMASWVTGQILSVSGGYTMAD